MNIFPVVYRFGLLAALALGLTSGATAQHAALPVQPAAGHAPTDRPALVAGSAQAASLQQFDALIADAVQRARRTLPQAKQRFLTGLPDDQTFLLTTRLYDADGTYEQVFVRVLSWEGALVRGAIVNELNLVAQYTQGQVITFPDKAILDWTISYSDGSEEGNYVGKFINSLDD